LLRYLCVGLLAVALPGCGGGSSDAVPITGTVTLDDKPLEGAMVTFHPEGETGGLGGSGRTGPDGKYTLTPARGKDGLPPGGYVVVVNRPLRKDGSLPPPDLPPIESDARESLPAVYSSRTASTLKKTVSKETTTYDIALKSATR